MGALHLSPALGRLWFDADPSGPSIVCKRQSYTRSLNGVSDGFKVVSYRCALAALKILEGAQADAGALRQVFLRPAQPASRRTTLL